MTTTDLDIGLLLTGGGARGAYQAGVLHGIAEIRQKNQPNPPFSIVTGASAGAINSTYIAANAHRFNKATQSLCHLWKGLHSEDIYKTSNFSLFKQFLLLIIQLLSGKTSSKKTYRSLLDNSPLHNIINSTLDFNQIQKNIDNNVLKGVGVATINYSNEENCIFFQTNSNISHLEKSSKHIIKTNLTSKHLVASSSIPLLFPPTKINGHYYGDGSLKNYSPLSPSIRLGAKKLLIISSVNPLELTNSPSRIPNLAKIFGIILNSMMMDGIYLDIDTLKRLNMLSKLDGIDEHLQHIDIHIIHPSVEIRDIALKHIQSLPKNMQYLLNGLGRPKEFAQIASYLLFEASFTEELISIGYMDVMKNKSKLLNFLNP